MVSSHINKLEDALRSVVYAGLLKLFPNRYMGIRASVELKHGNVLNCNWGDDLNVVIIGFFSKKKILAISLKEYKQKILKKRVPCPMKQR